MAQQEFLKVLSDFRTNPSNTLLEWQRQLNHILSNLNNDGYITFTYTPEDEDNKDPNTSLGISNIKYPSQNAVKVYVDTGLSGKENTLGFTAENVANKDTNTSLGTSDTKYPSQKATKSYIDTGLSSKEDTTNKSTNTSLGTSDILYPSQNAVKSYVDTGLSGKQNSFTGLSQTITVPDIDATNFHHFTFTNGVLTAYLKDTNP